jgi:hypothetical protein
MLDGQSYAYWHRWLTEDGGYVPCSRYGRDSWDCAWFAIALVCVEIDANGPLDDVKVALDDYMVDVVNDHDHVARLLYDHWYAVPRAVREHIGTKTYVKNLMTQAMVW